MFFENVLKGPFRPLWIMYLQNNKSVQNNQCYNWNEKLNDGMSNSKVNLSKQHIFCKTCFRYTDLSLFSFSSGDCLVNKNSWDVPTEGKEYYNSNEYTKLLFGCMFCHLVPMGGFHLSTSSISFSKNSDFFFFKITNWGIHENDV